MIYRNADERLTAEIDFQLFLSDLTPEARAQYWQRIEDDRKLSDSIWDSAFEALRAGDEVEGRRHGEYCSCCGKRAA
jgi:hypothetical protein